VPNAGKAAALPVFGACSCQTFSQSYELTAASMPLDRLRWLSALETR
jgi:hypothetical protein